MGVSGAMADRFPGSLGALMGASGSHMSFFSVIPPLEGQIGSEALETQQGHWRHDKLPGENKKCQPLKTVKP